MAAMLICLAIPCPAEDAALNAETLALLKEFSQSIMPALNKIPADEAVKKMDVEVKRLSKGISDQQLPALLKYALSKDGERIAWVLGYLFVERDKYEFVANVFVNSLFAVKENRYSMWKWWEVSFGEKPDYEARSRKLSLALMRQFEKASAENKLVIAELFGKGDAESKLSVEEFKKAVGFKTVESTTEKKP